MSEEQKMEETKQVEQEEIEEVNIQDIVKTEFNEGEVKGIEATVMSGCRFYTHPRLGVIKIRFPSIEEDVEINRLYSETFVKLIRNSELLPEKKLTKILEEKEIWTEQDDKNLEQAREFYLSKSVTFNTIELKKRKSAEDKKFMVELKEEIKEWYTKFINLSFEKQSLFENTIEKKAEEETLKLKMIKCCLREDDTPVWKSMEALLKEPADTEMAKFLSECMVFWRGVFLPLSEDWLSPASGSQGTRSQKTQE